MWKMFKEIKEKQLKRQNIAQRPREKKKKKKKIKTPSTLIYHTKVWKENVINSMMNKLNTLLSETVKI